ncbi:MAG: hypothetical protein AB1644_11825 [Candidatus Zixiibacteriota bacterium]
METDWKLSLIVDSSALIDYCESDLSILSLFSQTVQPVYVGKAALDNVKQLSETQARRIHIQIVIPDIALALEAAEKRGPLAYDDHETLLLAKSHGWCCLTNDKALRRECQNEGVQVRWGLEPMKILVAQSELTVARAILVAQEISKVNPFITQKIVDEFSQQIRKIKRS